MDENIRIDEVLFNELFFVQTQHYSLNLSLLSTLRYEINFFVRFT